MRIVVNAFIWLIFVCSIEVTQIGIIYMNSILSGKEMSSLNKFYSNRFLLFFSISLVAGVFYEFQFENSVKVNPYIKNILLMGSIRMQVFAMVVYALTFALKMNSAISMSNYISIQNYLAFSAILISATMKGVIYNSK